MENISAKLKSLSPNKFIIAIIGDANAGKTTTINKVFNTMSKTGKIHSVENIWDSPDINNPTLDFSLTGETKYGTTGIVSRGDIIYALKDDLETLVAKKAEVIICACRKQRPDTFNAVAAISWKHSYSIIWIDISCPSGISKDTYTDSISSNISSLF